MKYKEELPNVLTNITFQLASGENLAVLGRTGSGKSTLFLGLLKVLEPTVGDIQLDGISLKDISIT